MFAWLFVAGEGRETERYIRKGSNEAVAVALPLPDESELSEIIPVHLDLE